MEREKGERERREATGETSEATGGSKGSGSRELTGWRLPKVAVAAAGSETGRGALTWLVDGQLAVNGEVGDGYDWGFPFVITSNRYNLAVVNSAKQRKGRIVNSI